MCLQQASKLSDDTIIRFATLIHDLGKGTTPQTEWPRHIAHETRGLPLIKKLCSRLSAPKDYQELALIVSEYHTHCHRALELKPETLLKTLQATDALRRPERFLQFLICCEADARGRTGFEERAYPQADYFRAALTAAQNVDMKAIQAKGLTGKDFGAEVNLQRLVKLREFKQHAVHNSDAG